MKERKCIITDVYCTVTFMKFAVSVDLFFMLLLHYPYSAIARLYKLCSLIELVIKFLYVAVQSFSNRPQTFLYCWIVVFIYYVHQTFIFFVQMAAVDYIFHSPLIICVGLSESGYFWFFFTKIRKVFIKMKLNN